MADKKKKKTIKSELDKRKLGTKGDFQTDRLILPKNFREPKESTRAVEVSQAETLALEEALAKKENRIGGFRHQKMKEKIFGFGKQVQPEVDTPKMKANEKESQRATTKKIKATMKKKKNGKK